MGVDRRICLGIIVGVKGVRGEVRIKTFTEEPTDIAAYGPLTAADGRTFAATIAGVHQGLVIAKLKGVEDRDAAEALKGTELFVDRAKLPAPDQGSYYYADLIGLEAAVAGGESLGTVTAMDNFGASDVMQVTAPSGKITLVPFSPAVIAMVDLAEGIVTVTPVSGLLEDAKDDELKERGGDAA